MGSFYFLVKVTGYLLKKSYLISGILHVSASCLSLLDQSIPVDVVLVDDGSTDDTPFIGEGLGVPVIRLSPHRESYVGRPELALRVNIGVSYSRRFRPDYVMHTGGDHILPPCYCEAFINQMVRHEEERHRANRLREDDRRRLVERCKPYGLPRTRGMGEREDLQGPDHGARRPVLPRAHLRGTPRRHEPPEGRGMGPGTGRGRSRRGGRPWWP